MSSEIRESHSFLMNDSAQRVQHILAEAIVMPWHALASEEADASNKITTIRTAAAAAWKMHK